ncbi:hypothetical protein Goklo_000309 [Gossypium klotzschianum]|uniref:Uncharacterized protein n=1 Tax=Gossypium klotzschianum TaxID=34286 RepID=A0A7J8VX80_9ROSI|nr:hypothetical protein [Gossypium klotzschianum]
MCFQRMILLVVLSILVNCVFPSIK